MGEGTYHDAATSRHGPMICGGCNRKIESGEYRVRERPDRYVTHHRACCEEDSAWAARDRRVVAAREADARLLAAAREFARKWGISDLDDLMEEVAARLGPVTEGEGSRDEPNA